MICFQSDLLSQSDLSESDLLSQSDLSQSDLSQSDLLSQTDLTQSDLSVTVEQTSFIAVSGVGHRRTDHFEENLRVLIFQMFL